MFPRVPVLVKRSSEVMRRIIAVTASQRLMSDIVSGNCMASLPLCRSKFLWFAGRVWFWFWLCERLFLLISLWHTLPH